VGEATRRRGRHTSLGGAAVDGLDPVDRVFGPWPTPPAPRPGLEAGGARVYIRGEEPGPAADTVALGGPSRARSALPATAVAPVRPRYRRQRRLALVGAGLVLVVMAAYLGVPPLLSALGLGPQVVCRACQFPIPSAIAAAGGFAGQVTVVNRSSAAISGWRLIVALPGDNVSAVQNAEFTEDQGVLSMTPAPYDLSVAPGNGVTVSIYASGPVRTPAECTFNDVACR
jgi:Cellulose binding domain